MTEIKNVWMKARSSASTPLSFASYRVKPRAHLLCQLRKRCLQYMLSNWDLRTEPPFQYQARWEGCWLAKHTCFIPLFCHSLFFHAASHLFFSQFWSVNPFLSPLWLNPLLTQAFSYPHLERSIHWWCIFQTCLSWFLKKPLKPNSFLHNALQKEFGKVFFFPLQKPKSKMIGWGRFSRNWTRGELERILPERCLLQIIK